MFETLNAKLDTWRSLQPLKPEDERRWSRKLRLEWNYHSNHIEGNTLTYGETELLLIHDQTSGDHALRNYIEMKAHDVAIGHLRTLVDAERPLGESDIRDLNRILLKEPFSKEAVTPDGLPTRIEIAPGEYKSQSNNVRTADGGIFEFAPPTEVPARMEELVGWLREAIVQADIHPVEIASKMHHDFVLIHPFGDGNGRVARLIVNYVLMRAGYPPIIIPTGQKDSYLAALRLADAGDLQALTDYLAKRAEAALDLGIRAGRGEDIEEPDDLEKEIEVFKRRQSPDGSTPEPRTPERLLKLYEIAFRPLFEDFIAKLSTLDDLFENVRMEAFTNNRLLREGSAEWDKAFRFNMATPSDETILSLHLRRDLDGFHGDAPNPFGIQASIRVSLEQFRYVVGTVGTQTVLSYRETLDDAERKRIVRNSLEGAFENIKKMSIQA